LTLDPIQSSVKSLLVSQIGKLVFNPFQLGPETVPGILQSRNDLYIAHATAIAMGMDVVPMTGVRLALMLMDFT
jgi:hypothetical protein